MGMAMLIAGATFFLVYAVTIHPLGAHGLWIAFLSYLTVRSTLVWLLGARHYRG